MINIPHEPSLLSLLEGFGQVDLWSKYDQDLELQGIQEAHMCISLVYPSAQYLNISKSEEYFNFIKRYKFGGNYNCSENIKDAKLTFSRSGNKSFF